MQRLLTQGGKLPISASRRHSFSPPFHDMQENCEWFPLRDGRDLPLQELNIVVGTPERKSGVTPHPTVNSTLKMKFLKNLGLG